MDPAWSDGAAVLARRLERAVADHLSSETASRLRAAGLVDAGVLAHFGRPDVLDVGSLRNVLVDIGVYGLPLSDIQGLLRVQRLAWEEHGKRRRLFASAPADFAESWAPAAPPAVAVASGPGGASPDAGPVALAPAGVPPPGRGRRVRWPTRLRRRAAAAGGPRALADLEEAERSRWLQEFSSLLIEGDYPIAQLVRASLDPSAVYRRSAGGRRAGTVRQHVRAFRRFAAWRAASGFRGRPTGPPGVAQLLDFLNERAAGPCPRSVPQGIVDAVRFVEVAGGVPPEERLCSHPLVSAAVRDIGVSLAGGRGQVRRKAPQYPAIVLVALELFVADSAVPAYRRVLAWALLLRVWG